MKLVLTVETASGHVEVYKALTRYIVRIVKAGEIKIATADNLEALSAIMAAAQAA